MPKFPASVLDVHLHQKPDPDEFVQAAMQWHFGPETGSRFWLKRAASLGSDHLLCARSADREASTLRESWTSSDEPRQQIFPAAK
jgi:hypothetical protein